MEGRGWGERGKREEARRKKLPPPDFVCERDGEESHLRFLDSV